jgi:acyl carrier protein
MNDKIKSLVKSIAFEILEENGKEFKEDNLIIYGSNGLFDSMDLVNFISIFEERFFEGFNISIQLTHPSIFSNTRSPFKTIESIVDFVLSIL